MNEAPIYRFKHFELRPNRHQLVVGGRIVLLGSRAMDVLEALASRAGKLMTKQELLDRVWPDTVVQEANLAVQISALRKELGPDVIATIPGRGYRLIALAPGDDEPPTRSEPQSGFVALPTPQVTKLRTNLSAWTRPLLGRDDDLAAVRTLLLQHRVVTIAGAGGMGKTLLARHVLLDPPADFRHGVSWVELASTTNAAALPIAVAGAMGFELSGGGDALDQLAAWMAPLDLLLALDNAEHLLADIAAFVQRVQDEAPGVSILVTSQAPLRLAAECIYRLEPLAVPPAALTLERAMTFGAVALLADRALAADARFVLTDESVPSLVAICRALDGVPLALELAAARAPMLGLPRLMQSLKERLRLLNVNVNRWAPLRQQTLREAHEWSYRMLAPTEQEAFRRLGILVGSASLVTMQALASNGSPLAEDAWAALDSLTTLADRSLIAILEAADEGNASSSPRYRLLESSRLFALEKLQANDELASMRLLHARWMAGLCDTAWYARWSGEFGIQAWAEAIKPDLDDALEAFTWATTCNEPGLAVRIARTLLCVLPRSQQQHRSRLAEFCETFSGEDISTAERVQSSLAVCTYWVDSNWTRGAVAVEKALTLARRHVAEGGDPFWLYSALGHCATIHARRSDLPAAQLTLAEMRAAVPWSVQSQWPPHRLLAGASAEHFVARAAGDLASALALQRRRYALQQAAGGSMSISSINLMDSEIAAGEAASAVRAGLELVQRLEGGREEHVLLVGRLNLAAAFLALDDPARAREVALPAWPDVCRFQQQALWADYLALMACQESHHRTAARLTGYSEQAYARHGASRDHNEAAAFGRAVSLARATLGDGEFERLYAEGRTLDDVEASGIAFSLHDAA